MQVAISRPFHALLAGLNSLASVWVLFLVALISADVIGRAGFNRRSPACRRS